MPNIVPPLTYHIAVECFQEAASKGVSEEERAARIAAEKEKRMQDIISALTVLASSLGVRFLEASV